MSDSLKIFLLVIFSIFFTNIYAQTNIYEIEDEIKTELTSKYDSVYRIGALEDVNKEINSYRNFKFSINDPYNTLKNCYIFQADVNAGALFGIYKNGAILWDSGPIIEFGEYSNILGTMDLNNDGKVDILGGIYYSMHNSYQSIWIFSWDGENGSIINDYYSDRNLNKSVIFSFDWYTEIYDIDGDGILEIKGQDEETRDAKIYSWDGSKYGDYGVPVPQYVPMNLLSAKVSCKVTSSEYGLLFNYSVNSDSSSKQPIWRFAVDKPFENVYAGSRGPNNKWNAYSSDMYDLFIWDINFDQLKFPFDFISSGEVKSNFRLETATPTIIIGNFYVQGKNGNSFPDDRYIFENSFKGVTICGANPTDPFVPLDFLDTLLNYNQRSLYLGWISNQTTADKYDSLFTSAKTQLQQNNNNAAKTTLQSVLQEVDIDSTNNLTSEAYALLRYNTEYLITQIPEGAPGLPVKLINSQGSLLPGGSLKYYDAGWKDAIDNGDGTFTVQTERTTVSLKMTYEYGTQQKDNVTVGSDTVVFQTVNAAVQLKNSQGELIDTGTVQYYAGAWREFGTTINGVATKELLPVNYSFRMMYAYASNDKQQDIGVDPTVVFQTVNASVELKDSQGNLIDQGTVKYYAGGWRDFGTTVNGVANKELLPKNYSFRMTYAFASNDKQQDIGVDPTVVFQTVNAAVQLKDSQGNLIDQGTVKYYAGGWRDFGTTVNGVANKELLPKNYSFRMTYAYASNDKQQDIGVDPTVVFQTVNTAVQLKDSQGNLIDQGTVKYYAGGWRDFGTTVNGVANKELLPKNYSFRMTYAFASNDKQQDIGVDPTIVFQTVNAFVQLKDSQGSLIDEGTVKYYSGGWREFGTTVNGIAAKELLPKNYNFRMTYAFASNDKQQDIGADPTVVFQTVNASVQLKDSQGNLIDEGTVKYYAGGWRDFGTTVNGIAAKELLPKNYNFRMTYAFASNDKQQDIGADPTVVFQTVNASVQLKDSQGNLIDEGTVKYYSGGWREFGNTTNGIAEKELLPKNYSFRMTYAFASNDKQQDISTNSTITFSTVLCTVKVSDTNNQPIENAEVKYYSGGWREIGLTNTDGTITKELLPKTLSFRAVYGNVSEDKQQDIGLNNLVEFILNTQ